MTSPSIWDRITQGAGRLFGVPQGLLGDEAQRYATNQGLLGFGTALLGASGHVPGGQVPLSTNQILAQGLQAGQAGARGGLEMGLAMQDRERQLAREQLAQQIALRYTGKWDDASAIRQMAGELMQAGLDEESKVALDIANSIPEGMKPSVQRNVEVDGQMMGGVFDPSTNTFTPGFNEASSKGTQEFAAASTAAAEFRSQTGENIIRAQRLRQLLNTSADQAINASRAADQVAIMQAFLDITNRQTGSMRAANALVQSGATLRDIVDEKIKFFSRNGEASPLPTSQVEDMVRIINEGINDLDYHNQIDYDRVSGAFDQAGLGQYKGLLMLPYGRSFDPTSVVPRMSTGARNLMTGQPGYRREQ